MVEDLVLELKRGAKIYIGESISLIAFVMFFVFLPKISFLVESNWGGIIVMGWLGMNTVAITLYALYDFIRIMLGEQKMGENKVQVLVFKTLFFTLFFGVNMFFVMVGSSIAVPVLALMGTFLVLALTKENFEKKVPYMCLGVLWYVALFVITYLGHRVLYMLLYTLIHNITIVGLLTTLLLLGITFFILVLLLKKLNQKEV